MPYKWNFEIKKVNTFLSAVKRIGQKFVFKDTLNRKVRSGRPRVATIKEDHRLKITVLKEIFCWPQKIFFYIFLIKIPFPSLFWIILIKKKNFFSLFWILAVLNKRFAIVFKTVILSLWSCFIVEARGRPELTFRFNMRLITNICLILFTTETDVFNISIFKIHLVSHIFLSFSCNSIF